jgi:CIC family chloride channel protein
VSVGLFGAPARRRGGPGPAGGRVAWRSLGGQLAKRVNTMGFLPKWALLASLLGVIAGLGAVGFYEALKLATHWSLGVLAGYTVPTPAGEGGLAGSAHYSRPWAIPLVVVLGGLVAGTLVYTWAPEAEGHGTDAAISAVHHNPRSIRLRAVLVKIVASAATIGSGGSGGREGPTAQISAGFGSLLARVLDLSPEDGRIAVSVGIGSGIGAIFGAPLGGAVLAADIVYRDDFEYKALLPGTFASIIAYAIFGAFFGYRPLFSIAGGYHFQVLQLAWFAVIGVVAGGIGLTYSKSFYGVVALAKSWPFSQKLRPAVGAACTGLVALALPEVLGTGYGWVQKGLWGQLDRAPLYVVVALPFARIAATAFSIGSGGSGGVFGPGMVIGAFSGLATWRVLALAGAPGLGHSPAPFVVVGMMAVFGGISRAPVAVMLMVAEMTGTVAMVGPAMVAVSVAWFIVSRADDSIYRAQLRTRDDSPASRLRFGLPLLPTLRVGDVSSPPKVVLEDGVSVGQAYELLRSAGVPGAPVVDARGTYIGTVGTSVLAEVASVDPERRLVALADPTSATVAMDADLEAGLEALVQAGGGWVPVTSGDRRVAGILSASGLIGGYHKALDAYSGYVYNVTSHAVAVEERVGQASAVAGKKIREAGLPPSCIIVTVQHNGSLAYATGSTELAPGDIVSALVSEEKLPALRSLLRGAAAEGEQPRTDGVAGAPKHAVAEEPAALKSSRTPGA